MSRENEIQGSFALSWVEYKPRAMVYGREKVDHFFRFVPSSEVAIGEASILWTGEW